MSAIGEIQTKEDLLTAIGRNMLWMGRAGCITHYMLEANASREQAERDWEELRVALPTLFSTEELLADPGFDTDLKLLYTHFGGKMGRVFFEARLREFFSKEVVETLVAKLYPEITEGLERVARMQLMQHAAEFLDQRLSQVSQPVIATTNKTDEHQGTETWLVPCPDCETEKRVDHRTKRYRCKNCGFNERFPFRDEE